MRPGAAGVLGVLAAVLGLHGGGSPVGAGDETGTGVPVEAGRASVVLFAPDAPRPTPGPPPPDGPVTYLDEIPPDAVEIAAVGDVNLGGRIADVIRSRGPDHPWSGVAGMLRGADVVLVNLECTISERGSPLPKEFTFRGHPDSLVGAVRAGVDIASVANNHAADFGREAFVDTLRHLRAAGIEPVGGGMDREEAYRPVYVERKGLRLAFVAATRVMPHGFAATETLPGVASAYEERRLVSAVEEAAADADVVVVVLHWGTEGHTQPNQIQQRLARALVDAGAGVVIGHHPHRLQPVVRLDGALVAYSLGNFVFTSPSAAGRESMILRVGVMPDLSLVAARVPVRIEPDGRPVVVGAAASAA